MHATDDPRQRLLEAAGAIFAEKGKQLATVRQIIEKAGVNVAAVNYYYQDKDQLYTAAVRNAYRCCAARVPLPTWPPDTPPERKLRDFIRTFLTRAMTAPPEHAWHARLMMREMCEPTGACVEFVAEYVRPSAAVLGGILDELLPADVPAVKRHLIAHSIVAQCLHYLLARPIVTLLVGEAEFAGYDVETLTDHVTEFSLAGLGVRAPGYRKGRRS
jgi:AcrR family transcriptional regulator